MNDEIERRENPLYGVSVKKDNLFGLSTVLKVVVWIFCFIFILKKEIDIQTPIFFVIHIFFCFLVLKVFFFG